MGTLRETLEADSIESAAKSVTGRLAQTDPSLLGGLDFDAGERGRQARLRHGPRATPATSPASLRPARA